MKLAETEEGARIARRIELTKVYGSELALGLRRDLRASQSRGIPEEEITDEDRLGDALIEKSDEELLTDGA